jgi:adenylate kinase
MRAIVTGQVGMDKKAYLAGVASRADRMGDEIGVYHVGDRMYTEAPDVSAGRILDLPLSRLASLRRAVFRDIINDSAGHENVIVNTHGTFRWRHGLFSAFDFDQIEAFKPDLFVCLVDNIETVHHRLHRDYVIDATLKDCMVWREEEILASELLSKAVKGSRFFILSRGRTEPSAATLHRLICDPRTRKVYPSFPMSHVVDMPEVLAEIDDFRARLAAKFITFDPGDVDEKLLLERAIVAAREGEEFIEAGGDPISPADSPADSQDAPDQGVVTRSFKVPVREILDIAGDIDGQIYMRDFRLIDQSDMIVSFIPELPGGMPGLSSGVERELHHAFEHTKEVYIVWRPDRSPSPFITETATQVFKTVDEAMAYFVDRGMVGRGSLFENQPARRT